MGDKADDNDKGAPPTDAQEMSRFNGFSVIDGVAQEPEKAKPADDGKDDGDTGGDEDTSGDEGAKDKAAAKDDKGDKHRSAQDRIDKAIKNQRAAERRATAAENRANSLEQRLANIEARLTAPAGGSKAADADTEPDPKKYQGGEFDTRYIRDLARYEARQASKETSAQSREAANTQQAREAAAEAKRVIDDFAEKASEIYEDFAEVVFDDSNKFSPTLVELSLVSEFGAQIAYELALDAKEQRKVANMTTAQQARWFAKREIELESSKAPDADDKDGDDADPGAERRPKAPPPPKHQVKGSGGTGKVSAATPDFAAFERMAMGNGRN